VASPAQDFGVGSSSSSGGGRPSGKSGPGGDFGVGAPPPTRIGKGVGKTGIYPAPVAKATYPPKDPGGGGGFGIGDWLATGKHLAQQGEQAIVGGGLKAGTSVVGAVEDPIGTVKNLPHTIANAIKQSWAADKYSWAPFVSSLRHLGSAGLLNLEGNRAAAHQEWLGYLRDRQTFNRRFEQAPLLPLLDLATVVSFGGARLGALANLPADATAAEARAALIRGHNPGVQVITVEKHAPIADVPAADLPAGYGGNTVAVRTLPANAFRAGRMKLTDRILKAVTTPETKLIGQHARAGRATEQYANLVRLTLLAQPEVLAYKTAFGRLNKWQRAASIWRVKLPDPSDLEAHIAQLRKGGSPTQIQEADLLSNPSFAAEYLKPTRNTAAAIQAGRELMGKREQILQRTGHDLAELSDSPVRHTRVARGAVYAEVTSDLYKLPDGSVARIVEEASPTTSVVEVLRKDGKLVERTVPDSDLNPAPVTITDVPLFWRDKLPKALQGGPDPDAVASELAGNPNVETPYYTPDVIDAKTSAKGTGKPTGTAPPQSDVREWTGALMQAGTLATRPDTLSASFLHSVVEMQAHAQWTRTLSDALPIPKGSGLPHGYVWVRTVRGQHIPFGQTYGDTHFQNVGVEFPELGDVIGGQFTTKMDAEAFQDAKGFRYAVPEQYARSMRVQQRAEMGWYANFFRRSTDVWRKLVLNARVSWLVNNVVGNHIMGALRFAGPAGLRAYVDALGEVRGIKAVRELVGLSKQMGMSDAEMRQVFAGHTRQGTFIGANLPQGRWQGNVWLPKGRSFQTPLGLQKTIERLGIPVRILPHLDRATEGFVRRWGVNTELRRSPQVRAMYRTMDKGTRTWAAALERADRIHGAGADAIRNSVSRQVNDALGNFLSLSHAESEGVRGLIPFYAWYREISRVVLKFPLDYPGRADLVARLALAQPGQDLPSYLQGDVPVGQLGPHGMQTYLALRAMNPAATVDDLGYMIASIVGHPSKRGGLTALGLFNPFLATLGKVITSAAAGDANAQNVLDAFYNDFFKRLPETQPFYNPKSNIYPGRTTSDQWLHLLGSPVVRVSNPAAHRQHQLGR
jgi:hypothetical protein